MSSLFLDDRRHCQARKKVKSLFVFLMVFESLFASTEIDSDTIQQPEISSSAFTKFMEFQGRGSSQGAACYGDYLFVGNRGNRTIDVYDLAQRSSVGSISVPGSHPHCHANTLNFGTQFYQKGDEFPLLYISSGERLDEAIDQSNIFVYRIEKYITPSKQISFRASLVQTIDLVNFYTWTECITSREDSSLWIRCVRNGKMTFLKYPEPEAAKQHVTFTPTDPEIVDSIQVNGIKALLHIQGMLCEDGYITYATGMPYEVPYWAAINLQSKNYEYLVNLYEVEGFDKHTHRGLQWEPEYVFTYKGDYYLGFRKFIYKMDIEKVKQANYYYHRYMLAQ